MGYRVSPKNKGATTLAKKLISVFKILLKISIFVRKVKIFKCELLSFPWYKMKILSAY